MNEELIQKSLELAGYNMLVTSEISMKDKDVYNVIPQSLENRRILPDHEVTAGCQTGILAKTGYHCWTFLICYLAVLLTRLLQFKILKNGYSSEELFEFVRDFRVAKISDRKYINLSHGTSFIRELSELCSLPLTSYFLNEGDIKKMLSHRF